MKSMESHTKNKAHKTTHVVLLHNAQKLYYIFLEMSIDHCSMYSKSFQTQANKDREKPSFLFQMKPHFFHCYNVCLKPSLRYTFAHRAFRRYGMWQAQNTKRPKKTRTKKKHTTSAVARAHYCEEKYISVF